MRLGAVTLLRIQDPTAGPVGAGWRRLADGAADLEEGAVEPGGVGRDALHDGEKAVQLPLLVKHNSKSKISPLGLSAMWLAA